MTSMAEEYKEVYTEEELLFPLKGVLHQNKVRPYVIFNMLSTVDGRANVKCTSKTDRAVMGKLRSKVEGVMWGGGTIRADQIALRLPHHPNPPVGIIWTRSGNLPPDHPIFTQKRSERLVFTMTMTETLKEVAKYSKVHHVSCLAEMLFILWQTYDIKTLLVEGGPCFNSLLLSQNIGEEIFLTLAPFLLGDNTTTIVADGLPKVIKLHCRSVRQRENEVYLRYSRLA